MIGIDEGRLGRTCEVCGELRGGGIDHKECSEVNKELYGNSQENKYPLKKLSGKDVDYLSKRYR